MPPLQPLPSNIQTILQTHVLSSLYSTWRCLGGWDVVSLLPKWPHQRLSRHSKQLQGRWSTDRIPVWAKTSALVLMSHGFYTASHNMHTGSLSLMTVKWLGCGADHPPHLVKRFKKEQSHRGADKSLGISHFCHGDLVGRTTFWMFFEWLAKVRAMGYEVYWALWGVCWINPEFGHLFCYVVLCTH